MKCFYIIMNVVLCMYVPRKIVSVNVRLKDDAIFLSKRNVCDVFVKANKIN